MHGSQPADRLLRGVPWKRPTLIYHPGPPKMGTTSIQCALTQYEHHLRHDGYQFAGKIPTKFCPSAPSLAMQDLECIVSPSCQKELQNASQSRQGDDRIWTKLQRSIDRLYQKGINVALSDETHSIFHEQISYDGVPSRLFAHLFSNWSKHLIVGYRWYWQFWLSSRHEYNRLFTSGGRRHRMQHWNGRHLQSIGDMLRQEIATDSYLTPHTRSTLQMYQRYFDNITVLNIHDHEDMVQHFLCEILDAKSTCRAYHPIPKYNPSNHDATTMHASDIDRLVMASKRWINTTKHNRWHVVNKTLSLLSDVPRIITSCPSKSDLQRLLKKSLDDEERLFPNRRSDEHVRQFWETNFCSVDVTATLDGDDWRTFFQRYFAGR